MTRPDNTSVHHQGSIGKLAMRLVSDYAIPGDRAASIASATNAIASASGACSESRALLLACTLPHPTHTERVDAANALLRECGFVR